MANPNRSAIIGIYKLTSPSGKVYIGQSWDIQKRFIKYRNADAPHQRKLCASLRKYGGRNHTYEVILTCSPDITQRELDDQEQRFMDNCRALGCELLNIKEAGSRGRLSEETKVKLRGRKLTAEQRARLSEIAKAKGFGKWMAGRKPSPETTAKKSKWSRERRHSEATKLKMSESQRGRSVPEERKKKISITVSKYHAEHPRTQSQSSRRKISSALMGHTFSPESRQKISDGLRRYYQSRKGAA